jgi:hypothetical protein
MTERLTPTARSLTLPPIHRQELVRVPFGGWPALCSHPRFVRIGDGVLTAQSRAEVADITRRLGGRMKP